MTAKTRRILWRDADSASENPPLRSSAIAKGYGRISGSRLQGGQLFHGGFFFEGEIGQ